MTRAKNFHLPLPDETYTRLRHEASRAGRPATAVAREALEYWLAERERQAVHDSIAEYAREVAGTHDDLDPDLEAASLEHLAKSMALRKGKRSR